jgi:hypothetical protein
MRSIRSGGSARSPTDLKPKHALAAPAVVAELVAAGDRAGPALLGTT